MTGNKTNDKKIKKICRIVFTFKYCVRLKTLKENALVISCVEREINIKRQRDWKLNDDN